MSNQRHQEYVWKALQYIEENLTNPIQVEDICRQVPMSQWQFQRVFRFLVGSSLGVYLRSRRLSEAFLTLLEGPEIKIIDLALEFQFNSHEGFLRSFKSFFGCLPSEAKENRDLFYLKRSPALDRSKLDLIWNSIQDISETGAQGPFQLVGLEREVPSPFSNDLYFENETISAWKEFHLKTQLAPKSEHFSSVAYGVALNSRDQLISDSMRYFASKANHEFSSRPQGFDEFFLPADEFATFTIKGSLQQIHNLVDYIYGIWLPASGFQRGQGHDFERFDFKENTRSGHFIYSYNIPITKK